MKSKYKKIKYTNTGVKAPVVTNMKSSSDLDRSDMIELNYPEITLSIRRLLRKTMYNRAVSLITVETDCFKDSFPVHDTINDARVVCENLYIAIKKPEIPYYVDTKFKELYLYMREMLHNAKES